MKQHHLFLAVCLGALTTGNLVAEEAADGSVDFNRDIRPILSDRCFSCHGPDEGHREAGLRLDDQESAFGELESGAVAIVPGDLDASELVHRVSADDPDLLMPPEDSGKSLNKDEIALLQQWIEEGAQWQGHWAFEKPTKADPPKVKNRIGIQNEIDHFIRRRLEAEGLTPSTEADKATLLRRVTFDLTGLPPTLKEMEAFLADESPEAYEKAVDRLMASPRYGEHMARFWLDAVRYGDTHGLHLDNYREMWPYRDWVISAFNEDKPYNEFVTEQLAGDLLPNPTVEQLVATGFNRCHVTTNEGGSIKQEVYTRNVNDRVTTAGTVFMGLTFECTRCHDHKYDPLTQKDFYSMFAFFNSLDGAAMDGNKAQHPPVANVTHVEDKAKLVELTKEVDSLQEEVNRRRQQISTSEAFNNWCKEAAAKSTDATPLPGGMLAHYALDEASGEIVSSNVDGVPTGKLLGHDGWVEGKHGGGFSFDGKTTIDLGDIANFERDQQFSYGAWVKPRNNAGGAFIARMNGGNGHRGWDMYLQQNRVAVHLIHRWNSDALKVATKAALKTGVWQHVFATYDGSSKASGIKIYIDGKEQEWVTEANNLRNTTKSKVNLRLGRRESDSVFHGDVDDVRIYDRLLTPEEVATLAGADVLGPLLALAPEKRTPQQTQQLVTFYLHQHQDAQLASLTEKLTTAEEQKASIPVQKGTTLIWKELAKPKPAYILKRGEYDQPGEQVSRATPAVLPPLPEGAPVNRLGLAQWLTSPEHPLLARVTVNRFWQQLFGRGLVETSEDFGSQGAPPTHPQLLDWLAVQFINDGWEVKKTMKRMVMSATYRQSSYVSRQLLERDRDNRLLARGPRFRLDAEMLRDQALSVSGLLVNKIGGPGVKPPQPDGLWFAVGYSGSNTVRFKGDKEHEKIHRRTLYTFFKRTAPPPQMSILDAPSREACVVRRERTNTPLQMLMLMNDPQYVEAARMLAQRSIREGGPKVADRAAFMFRVCTGRFADEADVKNITEMYETALAEYEAAEAEANRLIGVGPMPSDESMQRTELAAWTMAANLVLCLDEVVTKN